MDVTMEDPKDLQSAAEWDFAKIQLDVQLLQIHQGIQDTLSVAHSLTWRHMRGTKTYIQRVSLSNSHMAAHNSHMVELPCCEKNGTGLVDVCVTLINSLVSSSLSSLPEGQLMPEESKPDTTSAQGNSPKEQNANCR